MNALLNKCTAWPLLLPSLQILTNGLYRPTLHRVLNTSASTPRISVPFFYEPCFEATVQPLLQLCSRWGAVLLLLLISTASSQRWLMRHLGLGAAGFRLREWRAGRPRTAWCSLLLSACGCLSWLQGQACIVPAHAVRQPPGEQGAHELRVGSSSRGQLSQGEGQSPQGQC